jgi:arabinose-5-phosphate isomerase
VHAADAVHGDLGLIGSEDVVVMLSNSGETDELTALLPHLDRRRVPLIAIVGNLASTVARHAAAVIDASVSREACSLDLAPTSSTTLALAIGDALAMTVAHRRGLTADDFATNHPSGRLGKRLTLRVKDLMHSGDQHAWVLPSTSWRDLVIALSTHRLGAANVLDDAGVLLGLVTDGDLRRALTRYSSAELDMLSAGALMTTTPVSVSPSSLAYDALQLMQRGELGLSVMPVVETDRRACGLLRLQDLVRAGI